MKKHPLFFPALLFSALLFSQKAKANPPLDIDRALRIAQDYLKENRLSNSHYISSISFERSAMFGGGAAAGNVKWEPAVKSDGTTETGIRINMHGEVTHLLTQPALQRELEYREKGARKIR